MLLRHYIDINPMISHKLFEYICNLLKSIYQLSWVIKTSIICRPMCLLLFVECYESWHPCFTLLRNKSDTWLMDRISTMFMAKLYKDLDSDMIGQYLEYLPSILECHEILPIKMWKKFCFKQNWNNITTWYVVPHYTMSIILRLIKKYF